MTSPRLTLAQGGAFPGIRQLEASVVDVVLAVVVVVVVGIVVLVVDVLAKNVVVEVVVVVPITNRSPRPYPAVRSEEHTSELQSP
jgi:hypothetical protein